MDYLKMVASGITIITGIFSLVKPRSVQDFTGLEITVPRGITEIRAVLGGLFIALGAAPLIYMSSDMYKMAGIGYLAVGLVRLVSIIVDKSYVRSNMISLIFEVVLGLILFI